MATTTTKTKEMTKDTVKKKTEVVTKTTTVSKSTTSGNLTEFITKAKTTTKKSPPKINYDKKGIKNKTILPDFVEICKKTQEELKEYLFRKLKNSGYKDVVSGNGYVYAKGTVPVLLTAHMDTVHREVMKEFYEYHDKANKRHIISSPQGIGGDDRCGIYMILQIIRSHKCSVLFCEDEEIGGIGSSKFCMTKHIDDLSDVHYLIELDRCNGNDAVFYDCDNPDFTKFILDNTGYKENFGSFSDISTLSPECGVASVNLSCGYYNAHTTYEYVVVEEMKNTIKTVRRLLNVKSEQFEYIDAYYPNIYDWDWYDSYSDYNYYDYSTYNKKNKTKKSSNKWESSGKSRSLVLQVLDYKTEELKTYVSNGTTLYEALGKFFFDNPDVCFNDIYDYEFFDDEVCDDGWTNDFY